MPEVLGPAVSWPRAAAQAARLGLIGLGAALVVALAGTAIERSRLGTTPQEGRGRVAADLRAHVATLVMSVRASSAQIAGDARLPRALSGDQVAVRDVFGAADATLAASGDPDGAITIYGPTGTPVAWSGRPSELPSERVTGPDAIFTHQSSAGLRLVLVRPVADPANASRRIGSVAAERVIAPSQGIRTPVGEGYAFDTPVVPVSLRPAIEVSEGSFSPERVDVAAPGGPLLLVSFVSDADIEAAHTDAREFTGAGVVVVIVVTFLLMTGPLLDLRTRAGRARTYVLATTGVAVLVAAARLAVHAAHTERWGDTLLLARATRGLSGLVAGSPLDVLLTSLAALAYALLLAGGAEAWRRHARHHGTIPFTSRPGRFALEQLAAGAAVGALLALHARFLSRLVLGSPLDLLRFSFHPWNPARVALDSGIVAWQAALLVTCVAVLRFVLRRWAVPASRVGRAFLVFVLWIGPAAVWVALQPAALETTATPYVLALVATAVIALSSSRVLCAWRHGSQFLRLAMGLAALLVPALIWYPALDRDTAEARRRLVEREFAPQALHQREALQQKLARARAQIDQQPGLADYAATPSAEDRAVSTEAALEIWRRTVLAVDPLTSAVELYGPGGALVSRFDFQLPEAAPSNTGWEESACRWDVFEEVSLFFSEERRLLHASRGLCTVDPRHPDDPPRIVGAIVVHVKLDYGNLPFISSQSPYMQLLRPSDQAPREAALGRDTEYVVYGWSRTPIYVSGAAAWPLPDPVFARALASRQPFWTTLRRGPQSFQVYVQNDRGGIYALGVPVASSLDHLVNAAELTALVGAIYMIGLVLGAAHRLIARGAPRGRGLLRELRESFYRKLFLAFVFASVVPLMALAFATRAYVVAQWRTTVEAEAVKIAESAGRLVEDYLSNVELRRGTAGARVDDDLLVWVSRLIDQDVNMFQGPRLTATSERNLFAAGLLPTRTPGTVYRILSLEQMPSFIGDEVVGGLRYMVAATPVRVRNVGAMLTVPLTLRQQEIEREIDELDRRVLLATLLFILTGAAVGYWMAERIADPVNRLTRATRRIARGDLDARILSASSDELQRLVEAFNTMAADLQAQRTQLERTNRLEAWAEMARQVAHEIKNPLTPIQLSAEHLRRVHHDRGEPLGPVLQDCIDSILAQVQLLRQIASEFSSFASAPTVRPGRVSMVELLSGMIASYRAGLEGKVAMVVDLPSGLPEVRIDRTLIARAFTNIIENALHAMPQGGTLTVSGALDASGQQVQVVVGDTGLGMDEEALERAFEPYFSTKATGTGLGLPLARRNVELNGGTIEIASERDRGTTVIVRLPVAVS